MQSALQIETKVLPSNKIEINLPVNLAFYTPSPDHPYIQTQIEPCPSAIAPAVSVSIIQQPDSG